MAKRRWFRRRKLTAPDGLLVTSIPYSVPLYGRAGSHSSIYRTQPNVRAVIDFLAEEVASVKLKVYQKLPTGPLLPSGRIEVEDHEMADLLNHPAPGMARSRFWKDTITDLHIHDVAYWQKIRRQGQVAALLRQPPSALVPERDYTNQTIVRYKTSLGTFINPDDLVIFHGYHPEFHDGYVSPLETLRRILAEEYAAGRNRENMWRNSTRKDGVVHRPIEAPDWDDEQREAWRLDWEGRMSGERNAGRVALLEDGMQWNDSSWSPQEMEYLEARKLNRLEAAALFRVDPRLVYAIDDKADKDVRTSFYVDRLVPLLTRLSDEIDAQLLPEFEPFNSTYSIYSEFNVDTKLRGSFEEQAKILVMTTGRAITTPNESRARLNLPPDPTGEGLTIPLNVALGGQASPLSPNETPGDLPALGQTPGPGALPRAAMAVSVTPEELAWLRGMVAKSQTNADEAKYAQVLEKHLNRQEQKIRRLAGAIKGPAPLGEVWDLERWDRELAEDLQSVGMSEMQAVDWAGTINAETRERLGDPIGEFDGLFGSARAVELAKGLR